MRPIRQLALLVLPFLAFNAQGAQDVMFRPYVISGTPDAAANQQVYANFCTGTADSTELPEPNYGNPLVKQAAARLSQTRTDAKLAQDALAKARAMENIKSLKERLKEEKSTAPLLVQAIAKLKIEIANSLSANNVTPEFNQALKALEAVYMSQIQTAFKDINDKLPNELPQVDFVATKAAGDALAQSLRAEVRVPDLTALKKVMSDIATQLKNTDFKIDSKEFKRTIEKLQHELGQVSHQSGELKESKLLLAKLALMVQTEIQPNEQITAAMESLDYYLDSIKKAQPSPGAKVIQLIDSFHKVFINVNGLKAIQVVATVNPQIQAASAFSEELSEKMSPVQQYMFNITAKSNMLWNLRAQLEKEMSSFDVRYFIESVTQYETLSRETPMKKAEFISEAANLTQAVDQRIGSLSQKTQQQQIALKQQVANKPNFVIVDNINKLSGTLSKGDTKMTEDLVSQVDELRYALSEKGVKFSATAQVAVAQYMQASANFSGIGYSIQSINTSNSPKSQSHFYFYGGIKRAYELGNTAASSAPSGTTSDAHNFLTQLCGEFRDRATMIEAKVKWVNNLFTLPNAKQSKIDPSKNIWSQVSASSYEAYLEISAKLWEARRNGQERYIKVGSTTDVDNPVAGQKVCETKFIFSEYVVPGKKLDSLSAFNSGYSRYKDKCPAADREDYYDFRGDSNFKHYSPESNGMIWYATSIAANCTSRTQAHPSSSEYRDTDCANYFRRPFYYRFNAARAGLATWLFYDDKYSSNFSRQGQMVAIYPHDHPESAPFGFEFALKKDEPLMDFNPRWLAKSGEWLKPDMGFNSVTGLGSSRVDQDWAYKRIRDAVDRHTDWYNSGFDDENILNGKRTASKNQAYSPFVASSYEMSASDGFTQCGGTVQCPDDGLKRWMFVFRVKASNWYTPARIAKNESVDFDRMWFDETSFGVSSLANGEKAWDRLGTPLEGEFDSILYLVNVTGHGIEEGGD